MVGRGSDERQTGGEIHTVVKGQSLESGESLVVIHGEHTIKVTIHSRTKETVCSKGSHAGDAAVCHLLNDRANDFLFLASEHTVVAGMRVESEHRNARIGKSEISSKRLMEEAQLEFEVLRRDSTCHF